MSARSSGRESPAPAGPSMGAARALFVSMRPAQWVKNLVLPLPFLFGGALGRSGGWILAGAGFAVFCAISSGVYLVNDIMDRERDRAHPVKRRRPLSTGELSVGVALAAAATLLGGGLLVTFLLSPSFARWCFFYVGLMVAYSIWLKRIPFLEALIVAGGLPIRALAGAALAGVFPSLFLMACAYLLAIFLVVGKRQWELQNAGREEHRSVLAAYREEGLDFVFVLSALSTVACYTAYSVIPSTLQMHGGRSFAATVPFVILGVSRYVRLVYRRGGGGNPTQALLIDDPWLLLIVLGWVLTAGGIIYVR